MQRHLPAFRDAIVDGALELCAQRQHGAEDFSNRREVVVRDPASELQELFVEHRRGVEYAEKILDLEGWLAIMQLNDDASHALLTKRNHHPPADCRRGVRRNTVGE